MKTLAKYHTCNHCVIDEKTFKNILIGPAKLPGLLRNGPQAPFAQRVDGFYQQVSYYPVGVIYHALFGVDFSHQGRAICPLNSQG